MHGLVNRSIQCFIRDVYGAEVWRQVCTDAGLGHADFEAMLHYDDADTLAVLRAAAARLGREVEALLEDMGHYLVTQPERDALRRLLRFGGADFADFLHSLADLQERGRLVLPEIDLPRITVAEEAGGSFTLSFRWGAGLLGPVVLGVLRAMADDYGMLALFDHQPAIMPGAPDMICVQLLAAAHSQGRNFALGRVDGA